MTGISRAETAPVSVPPLSFTSSRDWALPIARALQSICRPLSVTAFLRRSKDVTPGPYKHAERPEYHTMLSGGAQLVLATRNR
eukprot:COSAG03_NODE_1296_length_4380_cov_28.563390_6_plen_83_part_00